MPPPRLWNWLGSLQTRSVPSCATCDLTQGAPLELAYVPSATRGVERTASLLCYMTQASPPPALGPWDNAQDTNFPASRAIGNSLHPRTIFLMAKGSKGSHFSFKEWFLFLSFFLLMFMNTYVCLLRWKSWKSFKIILRSNTEARKIHKEQRGCYGLILHSASLGIAHEIYHSMLVLNISYPNIDQEKSSWWLCSR